MYPAQQLLTTGQARTGDLLGSGVIGVGSGIASWIYSWFAPPTAAEILQTHAEESIAGGVCDTTSPNYDAVACEHASQEEILHPQTDEELYQEHYDHPTTKSERCGMLDWPISSACRLGMTDESGEWNPTLLMGVKILAGVVAAGIAVKTISTVARLFRSGE